MTSQASAGVAVTLMRGGTSKGVFVTLDAVPADDSERRDWCLALMGSPDPMQLNGLGGGKSSTSKIMAVGTPDDFARITWARGQAADSSAADAAGCDLVYWFAQVGTDSASVDWRGNCGNLTAAVLPFALHRGLLAAADGRATVRILNINTGVKIDVTLPVRGGRLEPRGDFAIAGVPGTAARIDTRYLDPAGSIRGRALPTGSARDSLEVRDPRSDELRTVEASVVDVSTPIVVVDPAGIGLPPMVDPDEFNHDTRALGLLENIRTAAARLAGIVETNGDPFPAVPRVVIVSPAPAGFRAYATSMSVIHHALPGTVMLALAGAARIPGTLAHEAVAAGRATTPAAVPGAMATAQGGAASPSGGSEESDNDYPGDDIAIPHPKGTVVVSAPDDLDLPWVSLPRTARVLLDGTFYLP